MLIGAAVVVGPFEPTLLAVLASSAGAYLGELKGESNRSVGQSSDVGTLFPSHKDGGDRRLWFSRYCCQRTLSA